MQNEKVFRVRIEKQSLVAELARRLGYLAMFPFIQPEQARFELHLSERDQRVALNVLLVLASAEDRAHNLGNPCYILPSGERDALVSGVPRTWEIYEKVPTGGVVYITYVGAPETVNFHKRKMLFESYGHRVLNVEKEEVMWWSSMAEAPEDVIEYLEFLIAKFDDLKEAFVAIDGEGGNGNITLREFEDAYKEMGCSKFKGPDEHQRLSSVFRYLDPSGEGQISIDEFMVLHQLFKEIHLSIHEFVDFCIRTFGDDPADTWVFIDADQSGEVDQGEWTTACASLGYLGPVLPIFRYLDKDDEGTISLEEFGALNKFFKKTVPLSP